MANQMLFRFRKLLGGPVFLICYIGHKLWTKIGNYTKVEDIDVNKDRVVKDTEILHLETWKIKRDTKRHHCGKNIDYLFRLKW